MPYDGEFAGYRALQRITETERVKNLIRNARVFSPSDRPRVVPVPAPAVPATLPDFVVAIDGSNAEVPVRLGYPGARVGYCTIASVLLDLGMIDALDSSRPVDPVEFRKVEAPSCVDAALPGSNVVTRIHTSARDSFRAALYEVFADGYVDEQDEVPLLDTYERLLSLKPRDRDQQCPYATSHDCEYKWEGIPRGLSSCPCPDRRPIYSTDALRIHEGFNDLGSNREALGEVMQVWERVLLIHLLRCFEKRGWLGKASRIAFFVDGPLAVFGHPAWLSAAIKSELMRINTLVRQETGSDLIIIGVEKTGEFVEHFTEIDQTETPGELLFPPRTYQLLLDSYIKERVKFSDSKKRYGVDTYFGRKVFYKTTGGARIVATIPFLSDAQDTLDSADPSLYPTLPVIFALLDKLVSSRYPNALAPLVSANAHAAIPLQLGAKVLQQLARALMKEK